MPHAMMRSVSLRLLAPLAVLLGIGVFAFDRLPAAFGGSDGSPAAVRAAARATARAPAANPAWGQSGVGHRYAFDGKCDDPRFSVTTGAADPGSDEYDCARHGGPRK